MSTTSTQNRTDQLWIDCVRLLHDGHSARRVRDVLIEQDWTPADAQRFVAAAEEYATLERNTPEGIRHQLSRAARQLQFSGLWIGAGVIVASLMKVWPRSEILAPISFILLVYGLIDGFSGLRHWVRCRKGSTSSAERSPNGAK